MLVLARLQVVVAQPVRSHGMHVTLVYSSVHHDSSNKHTYLGGRRVGFDEIRREIALIAADKDNKQVNA